MINNRRMIIMGYRESHKPIIFNWLKKYKYGSIKTITKQAFNDKYNYQTIGKALREMHKDNVLDYYANEKNKKYYFLKENAYLKHELELLP